MIATVYRVIEPLFVPAWLWTLDPMPPGIQAGNLAAAPLSLVQAKAWSCFHPFRDQASIVQYQHLILALNAWAVRCNTRPHARLPPSFLGIKDLTTERSFNSQARWAIDELWLFCWHVIQGCLYNLVLADVRSTRAEIKCLYCNYPGGHGRSSLVMLICEYRVILGCQHMWNTTSFSS